MYGCVVQMRGSATPRGSPVCLQATSKPILVLVFRHSLVSLRVNTVAHVYACWAPLIVFEAYTLCESGLSSWFGSAHFCWCFVPGNGSISKVFGPCGPTKRQGYTQRYHSEVAMQGSICVLLTLCIFALATSIGVSEVHFMETGSLASRQWVPATCHFD